MTLLTTGLLIFIGVHLIPMIVSLRLRLIEKLGEPIYKSLFALASAIGFIMLLMGKGRSEYIPLYDAPTWAPFLAKVVMLPGFVLLIAAYYPNNIKRLVKHPMLWGVLIWSASHLLANGDKASVLLFGGFFVFSVLDLISMNWRKNNPINNYSYLNDMVVIIVGSVVYYLVYQIHGTVFAPIY